MNTDLMIVALMAGAANWAFRVLPTRMKPADLPPDGIMARFLAATGPAAIGTLFVASILPALSLVPSELVPLVTGTLAVIAVFATRRSVVASTLAGALVHGLTVWAMA
ncbi:AzlD domain-containing protein [Tabrizicola sp.]|uniref:AzlD domain-containing protein n=1 Tax=Tabrizicola sp. TaxID=2005166 RepID=UPI003F363AC7